MSSTITEMETTTTVSPSPLSYTASSFLKHNNSSSDSLDSQSTIKVTSSPSPTPTITTNATTINNNNNNNNNNNSSSTTTTTIAPKKITIPNYYVPPKVPIINTNSNEPTSPSDFTTLPPKLIRKKSGELVKSSLKLSSLLQRSLSTPQLSSKATGQSPSTPRKSVRFASRLIKVKMFDGCDSPSTVSSTSCSPCHSPPSLDFEPDFFNNTDDVYTLLKNRSINNNNKKRAGFDLNWDKFNTSSSSSEDEDEDEYWSTPKLFGKNKYNHNNNNNNNQNTFASPVSREYRLTSHNIPKMVNTKESIVWLPSVYVLKSDGQTFLYGLVNVKNLAFEKKIFLKLTLNNWKTSIVFGGQSIISYVKSIDSIDQFKFKISLDDLIYGSSNVDLQMCVKYEVGGATYWDNNFGNNYQFKLTRVEKKQALPHYPRVSTNSTTKKREDESPQFNELVSKLMLHKDSTSTNGTGRSFSVFGHNFEDSKNTTPRQASVGGGRPLLGKSFSSSDITTTPRQRYSQRHQRSHRNDTSSSTNSTSSSSSSTSLSSVASTSSLTGNPTKLDFSSLSYTDLLNNYCFANNSTTSKLVDSI